MKKIIKIIIVIILIGLIGWFSVEKFKDFQKNKEVRAAKQAIDDKIDQLITARQNADVNAEDDPFGDKDSLKILLLGLDSRIGDKNGHCDAIQFIEINKKTNQINITAVPRGTYSPLPEYSPIPREYYISKACEVGGLEYGIEQIEKILGQKADYLVMVGFSEAIGIFRNLNLPTTETLQWLRNRQSFAIGEPQRAHNHSTFIKQMIVKFAPKNNSKLDTTWQYLIYKLLKTDLSFTQVRFIADTVQSIKPNEYPQRIQTHMRPSYEIQEIKYDEVAPGEQVKKLLGSIVDILPENDYSNESLADIQGRLLKKINQNIDDKEFVRWAYDNHLWLQIEDDQVRQETHFSLLNKHLESYDSNEDKELLISEYIIAMQALNLVEWKDKGKELLFELQK